MKKILQSAVFGKDNKISGFIAFAIVGMIVLGCNCNKQIGSVSNLDTKPTGTPIFSTPTPPPKPTFTKADASKGEVPSDAEAQEMVRTTLLDFNDAIQKADFTTFYGNISRAWQRQITPDKFKTSFQGFIDGKADLSEISSQQATFSPAPAVDKSQALKALNMNGSYPTRPNATTFELKYIAEGKEWKLFGIQVVTNIKKKQ